MPAGLWGRAEGVRTFVRSLAQALAPLVFGGLGGLIAGFYPPQAPIGTHPRPPSSATAHGLEITFLILLVTLAAAGIALLRARHTYPRDVATAGASHQGSGDEPEAATAGQRARVDVSANRRPAHRSLALLTPGCERRRRAKSHQVHLAVTSRAGSAGGGCRPYLIADSARKGELS